MLLMGWDVPREQLPPDPLNLGTRSSCCRWGVGSGPLWPPQQQYRQSESRESPEHSPPGDG